MNRILSVFRKPRRTWRAAAALAVCSWFWLPPGGPTTASASASDDVAAAEVAFEEAARLLAAGKTEEACAKLAASHRLDPSYGAAYNLGRCHESLGRTASAWAAFREAAQWAKKHRQVERHERARQRAAALEPRLVKLRVVPSASLVGLSLQRDGTAIDPALWGVDLPVDPGSHTLTASAPGKREWTHTLVLVEPGQTVVIEIPALEGASPAARPSAAAVGPPRTGPEPRAREGLSTQRAVALGTGGLGVAGLTVGTIFAVLATSTWEQAKRGHCDEDNVCDDLGVELHGRAKGMSHAATTGFIAGGIGLATAVALWVTAPETRGTSARRGLGAAPFFGPSGGGVLVTGRFR